MEDINKRLLKSLKSLYQGRASIEEWQEAATLIAELEPLKPNNITCESMPMTNNPGGR